MMLEVLNGALVGFGLFTRGKRAKVAAFACLGILLA